MIVRKSFLKRKCKLDFALSPGIFGAVLAVLCAAAALLPRPSLAEGLNCETTLPQGVRWADYYDRVGDIVLFHDDECGMSAPVEVWGMPEGESNVRLDLHPFPHRFTLKLFLETETIELGSGGHVVVFRASHRGSSENLVSLIELRLLGGSKGSQNLQLVVVDGPIVHSRNIVGFRPQGSLLELEVTKSTMEMTRDGSVRVSLLGQSNEGEPAEITDLDIWGLLPSVLETGRIETVGFEASGRLVFQPVELGQQFFVISPQPPPL